MKIRRAMTAAAITAGLVLTVAGCGGDEKGGGGSDTATQSQKPTKDDGSGDKTEETQEPAADQVLAESKGSKATLTVNSAVRDEGGFLTLSGKVKNTSGKFWNPAAWRGDEKELQGNGASMAGASLIDKAGKKRYLILRDTEGRCLCTQFKGGLSSDEETSWFAQFPAPPAGTTTVDLQFADMPPATVEISEGE
ncbi:hypothetical protein P8605_10115 [Streptomyces sp. T-3]|nr:hypothetical protein [Streptomyces sp. T-3]